MDKECFDIMKNLEIGDLIEIFKGEYIHWALYVGGGNVIHLTSTSEDAMAGSSGLNLVGQTSARVKADKLTDLVGQDTYRISNHLDKKHQPRPIIEILKDTNSRLGKIIPYDLLTNNCEHFVTCLRYGTPQSLQNLEIGDLIEIFKRGYMHWALYVGGGDVIHLTLTSKDAKAGSSGLNLVEQTWARVKREKLTDVIGQNRYQINNRLDTKYQPRRITEILKDANSRLGMIVPYDLLKNNCEHFVTDLRYGTPQSQQAENAVSWTVAGVFTLIGAAAISAFRFIARSN